MCKQRISLNLDSDVITNLKKKAEQEERTVSQQVNLELKAKYSNWGQVK